MLSQEQGVTVAKNRFAPRGPSKRVIATIVSVSAVIVIAGSVAAALLLPPSRPAGESYSGETDVKASVFVPSVKWNSALNAVELSAIVTARIDPDASCTLTVSNDHSSRTAKVKAVADASTMTCANMSVPMGDEGEGAWTVVVTYVAGDFTAESQPMTVEVGA